MFKAAHNFIFMSWIVAFPIFQPKSPVWIYPESATILFIWNISKQLALHWKFLTCFNIGSWKKYILGLSAKLKKISVSVRKKSNDLNKYWRRLSLIKYLQRHLLIKKRNKIWDYFNSWYRFVKYPCFKFRALSLNTYAASFTLRRSCERHSYVFLRFTSIIPTTPELPEHFCQYINIYADFKLNSFFQSRRACEIKTFQQIFRVVYKVPFCIFWTWLEAK